MGTQFILQFRKKGIHNTQAAIEQRMEVSRLRHAFSRHRSLRKSIALNNRDTLKLIAKWARGEKPCHAAANDHGVIGVKGVRFARYTCSFGFHEYSPLSLRTCRLAARYDVTLRGSTIISFFFFFNWTRLPGTFVIAFQSTRGENNRIPGSQS